MRFLHLADLHLGKNVGGFSLLDDQAFILEEALRLAISHEAEAIVIAGDIYDRAVPPEEAVRLLDGWMQKVHAAGLCLLVISGNHDSDERLHFGSGLMAAQGVYIAGRYEGRVPRVTLRDAHGAVHFDLLPFIRPSWVAHTHPEATIASQADAVRVALSDCGLDPAERHVLVAHQFFMGGSLPELSGSEAMDVVSVGTMDAVPAALLAGYDYVALGHIHQAQAVGRDTCRYAGTPLKYHRTECLHPRTAPLVTLGEKGQVAVELLPLTSKRDMRAIRGTLEELLRPDCAGDTDDYIYATLTDEQPAPGATDLLRQRYPCLLGVMWDNAHLRGLSAADAAPAQADFDTLIDSLYRQTLGREPSADELALLRETAQKAGVTR